MPEQVILPGQADCGGLAWTRTSSWKTEARYSSEVQQRALAITDVDHP
jgi:hypothetical protein